MLLLVLLYLNSCNINRSNGQSLAFDNCTKNILEGDCTGDEGEDYECYVDDRFLCSCRTLLDLDVVLLFSLSEPDDYQDYENYPTLFSNWATFASYIIDSLSTNARIGIYTENQGIVTELQSLSDSESNTDVSESSSLLLNFDINDDVSGREHSGQALINLLPLTFLNSSQDSPLHANVLILMFVGEDQTDQDLSSDPQTYQACDPLVSTLNETLQSLDITTIVITGDDHPQNLQGDIVNDYNCLTSTERIIHIDRFIFDGYFEPALQNVTSLLCAVENNPSVAPTMIPSISPSTSLS